MNSQEFLIVEDSVQIIQPEMKFLTSLNRIRIEDEPYEFGMQVNEKLVSMQKDSVDSFSTLIGYSVLYMMYCKFFEVRPSEIFAG